MSKYFIIGRKLQNHGADNDEACEEAYKQGAEAFPWLLECTKYQKF